MTTRSYHTAIVGAGPVGSLCALVLAQTGKRVALLEANPKAMDRLAGEWLHPPAVRALRELGFDVSALPGSTRGDGFAVFPEDGTEPILLPYADDSQGLVVDHATLVSLLREAADDSQKVDYIAGARVTGIDGKSLTYMQGGVEKSLSVSRVVGADGRTSVVRKSLGLPVNPTICSRMLGVTLSGAKVPFKNYGHVVLGGPGPILIYTLHNGDIRVSVDIPLEKWVPHDRIGYLSESCAKLLPGDLGDAFIKALQSGAFHAAVNQFRPRVTYGNSRKVLIGDAAGHYHPLTAVGMTLGFGDAQALAKTDDFHGFTNNRLRAIRMPELLAMGLYEVFADYRAEAASLRSAIYRGWRSNESYRNRTMRILACEDRSVTTLFLTTSGTITRAFLREIPILFRRTESSRVRAVYTALAERLWWFTRSVRELRRQTRRGEEDSSAVNQHLSRAFLYSLSSVTTEPTTQRIGSGSRRMDLQSPDARSALQSATSRLLSLQGVDGAWEGEMVWCPMLSAQYALLHWIIGRPMEPDRRRRLLRSFERSRLADGTWGMHEHSKSHLFVTSLVYVAARTLGVEHDDPLVSPAREFIRSEDVTRIPSWGKFWLAVLNLYRWEGINPILPELWVLPGQLPFHPSKWYCHTRLIALAMSVIYAQKFQVPVNPLVTALRSELYVEDFDRVNFAASRNRLRLGDLFAKPSILLKGTFGVARLVERFHGRQLRQRCVDEMLQRIRWEVQTTTHTSISPVSGLLNILSLWLRDPKDTDCQQALDKLEGWIWEDEDDGVRVTGARSASWDTGFALQALATLPESMEIRESLNRGASFLLDNQIRCSFPGFKEAFRSDPKGGWCFAGGWHGWPVSDCTAEAVCGLIDACGQSLDETVIRNATGFMLRSQNRDGGFGSYESRRSAIGLEWLNPAEMFGESMTEHSFVECTASCLAALAACRTNYPDIADNEIINTAIMRGGDWLRRTQGADGSWRGVWGVQYIYGTLFGIRGLLAAGTKTHDAAMGLATRWLLEHQLDDGGWGEHHSGCLSGKYVEHHESQVIQTSWALIALLEAKNPDWFAISRAAKWLLEMQQDDGGWPKQDMAGVFFRTALLDYVLYRQYFPLHALGLYERRRRARLQIVTADAIREKPEALAA